MAYNDEALKAKLSTLNETQDSIVSVSQWITFHKRHADRIASYWLTRLRDAPPPKRLNFIYLVNDIVQNARARKRAEFPDAFAPLMPEAIQTAYRSSGPDIQSKIRRVVEVWRTRVVFEAPIQSAIEARMEDIDKSKGGSGKKTLMGNSLFTSTSSTGMPKELETLSPLQTAVTKSILAARPNIDTAQAEYTKINDPDLALPSPPVHAARLSSLMKALANAESSVSASIKARQALIADLERILDINKSALAKDEETYLDLSSRRTTTEAKKREVEDSIMRGLSTDESAEPEFDIGIDAVEAGETSRNGTPFNPERPDFEELTPEPDDQPAVLQPSTSNPQLKGLLAGFTSSSDEPSTLSQPNTKVRAASNDLSLNGNAKRRKMSHGDNNEQGFIPDFGNMGMDEDEYDVETAMTGVAAATTTGGETMQGQNSAEEGLDLLRDLDQDVNDLIRQGGA